MRTFLSVLLIIAFLLPVPVPVRADHAYPTLDLNFSGPAQDVSFSSNAVKFAALDSADFVPVERKLIDEQMGKKQPTKWKWWHYALGILVVGGIAAAAGGGGGGGGGSAPAPTTGTITGSW